MKKLICNLEKYLSIVVILLAILSFIICFFFPIYTDEIVWKAIQGRYWADGNQALAQTLCPSCGSYSHVVPMMLLPYRILSTFINTHLLSPLLIRLFGMSVAFTWLFVTWLLFRALLPKYFKSTTIALCLIAFATLGVMPLLLVISRPEQCLLLCMTLFFVPLLKENSIQKPTIYRSCFNAIGIFLLASFMLTIHPKALFALPLVFVSMYRFVKPRELYVLCMIAISIFSAIAYHDWSLRWSCLNDPYIADILRKMNLGAITNLTEFKHYFSYLIKSLIFSNSWYINFAVPKTNYISNMIPPFTNIVMLIFGQILRFLLTVTFIAAFIVFISSTLKRWRNTTLDLSHVAIGTIWLFYAASVVTRIEKNDYEATLIVPLLALAVAGTLWVARATLETNMGKQNFTRYFRFFFLGLLSLSVLSQIAFITTYLPYAITSWGKPGYIAGQRVSISNFGYNQLRPEIVEAAAKCGIHASDKPHHLVVDELTYFVFIDSYQPFFMTSLDELNWYRHQSNPTPLLMSYQSAGMIVGCQWIPSALRAKATRDGKFCCLPAFL